MMNAISSALSGLTSASQKVTQSANNIANVTTDDGVERDLATDIVNLKVAETEFKANVATLETARELSEELGRLFDREV